MLIVYSLKERISLSVNSKKEVPIVIKSSPEDSISAGELIWESSNDSIVDVTEEGEVIGIDCGTATITAKSEDGKFSASCTVTVSPSGTEFKKVVPKVKQIGMKWKKARSSVDGYQIQYSPLQKFDNAKKVKKAMARGYRNLSKTISGLKGGRTYYVRIRTYKEVNGTKYFSAWSSTKSAKVKKK